MGYGQHFRGAHRGPSNRRVAEDGSIPSVHPAGFHAEPTYEPSIHGQGSGQPTTNHPPVYPFALTRSSSGIHSCGVGGGSYGSKSLCPPPSVTHPSSHGLAVEARGQGGMVDDWQELRTNATQASRNVSDPHERTAQAIIPLERAGEYTSNCVDWNRSPCERSTLGSQQPGYPPHGRWEGPVDPRSAPLRFNNPTSTSGGGRHGNRLQGMGEDAISVPHPSPLLNDLGLDPYATMDHTTFARGGPLEESWGERYIPHPGVEPRHWDQQQDNTPTSPGPSGGRTDALERAGPSGLHSLSSEGMGNAGHVLESSPNLRLDSLSDQPAGVRPRKGKRAKQPTGPAEIAPPRKSTRKFLDSIAQLRATSVVICGPTRLVEIPQTWYKCITKQDKWKGEPIEFGSIKLIDAADSANLVLHNSDEKVLNYDGVGTTILCRLGFPGRKIGPSKILTTNSKTIREHITKGKLALEVAKFVWNNFECIKAKSGFADITFENMVLVRLVRVSRASWQPELGYEAPILGPSPS